MTMKLALIAGSAAMLALHGTNAAASLTYEYTCESYDLEPINLQLSNDPVQRKLLLGEPVPREALHITNIVNFVDVTFLLGDSALSKKAIDIYWNELAREPYLKGDGSTEPQYRLLKDYFLRGDATSLRRYFELPVARHDNDPPWVASWRVQDLGPLPYYKQSLIAKAYLALEEKRWEDFDHAVEELETATAKAQAWLTDDVNNTDRNKYYIEAANEGTQQVGKLEYNLGLLWVLILKKYLSLENASIIERQTLGLE